MTKDFVINLKWFVMLRKLFCICLHLGCYRADMAKVRRPSGLFCQLKKHYMDQICVYFCSDFCTKYDKIRQKDSLKICSSVFKCCCHETGLIPISFLYQRASLWQSNLVILRFMAEKRLAFSPLKKSDAI